MRYYCPMIGRNVSFCDKTIFILNNECLFKYYIAYQKNVLSLRTNEDKWLIKTNENATGASTLANLGLNPSDKHPQKYVHNEMNKISNIK